MKKFIISFFQIFLPILLGGVVGIIMKNSIDYENLIQPPLSPPSILFPIIWSILYLLMGISYFLYRKDYNDKDIKIIYYLQLFFNLLWSIAFFVLKWRFFSIIWILILDILVYTLIKLFLQRKKISAYLNIPYLIWILFATYLNIGVYILN